MRYLIFFVLQGSANHKVLLTVYSIYYFSSWQNYLLLTLTQLFQYNGDATKTSGSLKLFQLLQCRQILDESMVLMYLQTNEFVNGLTHSKELEAQTGAHIEIY